MPSFAPTPSGVVVIVTSPASETLPETLAKSTLLSALILAPLSVSVDDVTEIASVTATFPSVTLFALATENDSSGVPSPIAATPALTLPAPALRTSA